MVTKFLIWGVRVIFQVWGYEGFARLKEQFYITKTKLIFNSKELLLTVYLKNNILEIIG